MTLKSTYWRGLLLAGVAVALLSFLLGRLSKSLVPGGLAKTETSFNNHGNFDSPELIGKKAPDEFAGVGITTPRFISKDAHNSGASPAEFTRNYHYHNDRNEFTKIQPSAFELSDSKPLPAVYWQDETPGIIASPVQSPHPVMKQVSQPVLKSRISKISDFPEIATPVETIDPPGNYLATLPPSQKISDTFVESDLRQALQSLAAQANVSVLIDDGVSGAANADFEEVDIEAAIRQLLIPLGYVYRRNGDEFFIGVADPDSAMFPLLSERRDYHTVHRSPEELHALLSVRHQRFIRKGEFGNLMIIEAPPQITDAIEAELVLSDQPPPQIVLEAMVCVYAPNTSFRFGFDMEQGVLLTGRAAGAALSGLGLTGTIGPAGFNNLNNFTHTKAVLKALQQEGYLSIQAAPKIMARDGKKAEIQIGRESYFSVQQGNNALLRNDIQKVESGIMLDITPMIRGDRVSVEIERAEVSEDIRTDETAVSSSGFPVINRRRVATTVHVGDGETIVIGGLTQNQIIDQQVRMPVMSRIPLVGKLFQRIEKVNQTSEVAIFISPRIVKSTEQLSTTVPPFPGPVQ